MQQYLESIEKSISSGNYFGALSIALMLPDICSAIESPDNQTDRNKYCKWFDSYLSHHYTSNICGTEVVFLSAKECYALRCSYLHQGIHDIAHQKILRDQSGSSDKIIFMAEMGSDNLKINHTLCLSLEKFCARVVSGVEFWVGQNNKNELVAQRIYELPKVHVSAFSPIYGVQVG